MSDSFLLFSWNARGVVDDLPVLFDRLSDLSVDVAGIMESKVFKEDLSQSGGPFKWFNGPEPVSEGGVVHRGLGAFVNVDRFPAVEREWSGVHSFALKFPAGESHPPRFVVFTHVPMYSDPDGRSVAFGEVEDFLVSHRKIGPCVIAGDFNSI